MLEPTRRALHARRAFAWSVGWLAAAALYLLIVGAGAALLAATGAELAREQGIAGESVRVRWLARLYRPMITVPKDVVSVSLLAVRALVDRPAAYGTFRVESFDCIGDDPHRAGRLALAEAVGSLAPNTFVVGIDPERGLIFAHQLKRTEGREAIDPMSLGEPE
jgi:hypothetical protein